MKLSNQLRFILPFLIFLSLIMVLWRGLALHPNEVPSPLINKKAPEIRLLDLVSNKMVTNKDFYNHVTLLNVWATWCAACADEHEFLLELARKKQVMIYGLNYKDDSIAAIHLLKDYGNPYQKIAYDKTGETAIDWGVYGTPETFIIDKKGFIRYKHIGPLSAEVWEKKIKQVIQQLQEESI